MTLPWLNLTRALAAALSAAPPAERAALRAALEAYAHRTPLATEAIRSGKFGPMAQELLMILIKATEAEL